MQGKIIKSSGGFYYIQYEDQVIETRARGVFRHENIEPVVGDFVDFKYDKDTLGYIEKIYPRKNMLIRPKVANVDQAFIVIPLKNPEYNLNLIDKMIVQCESSHIPIIIVINKTDLDLEQGAKVAAIYEKAGFPTLQVSAITKKNMDVLKGFLRGKTTALCGVSGAGKSSLTNALMGIHLPVGDVSQKTKRGKHTTRHVEIYHKEDYYLFDTPGFSSLALEMEKEDLSLYFREFEQYLGQCKFVDCQHMKEPQCAVRDAVIRGEISPSRYENYVYLFEELKKEEGY